MPSINQETLDRLRRTVTTEDPNQAAPGWQPCTVFGITSGAFRVAGGIIVFLIGYRMLQGEPSSLHQTSRAKRAGEAHHRKTLVGGAAGPKGEITGQLVADAVAVAQGNATKRLDDPSVLAVAVTPLEVPLLAGPGGDCHSCGFLRRPLGARGVTVFAFARCHRTAVSSTVMVNWIGRTG